LKLDREGGSKRYNDNEADFTFSGDKNEGE